MAPAVQDFYFRACSILSLTVFGVFFCLSRFVELQFADSKLSFSIFMVILLVALSTVASNPELVRETIDGISWHPWIFKAFSQFIILALVTTLIVWIKYPRFRVSDISATSKQGDLMGFIAAGAFSLYILSTSMLLKLREEFGLFYLSLEYTMTAAVEMPDPGGHMVNWRFVVPTAIYCFLLIIFRCYCHSSDDVGRKGNNHDHGDDDDAGGAGGAIRSRVESQPTIVGGEHRITMTRDEGDDDDARRARGLIRSRVESQPITWDQEKQQGGDDDGAGEGGETGDRLRTEMDRISTHRSRWIRCILKAFSQFIILALVTTLIAWIKYPRFGVSDIYAIIRQVDQMGFIVAGAFSLYILSTSVLLKLRPLLFVS